MTTTTDKKQEALDKLAEGIKALLESGDWENYLKTQAKFHNYSASNCFLILAQSPEASQVAGYNTWKKLKRQVRKGEKAIKILAPLRRKVEDEEGETKYVVSGFRAVSVFDLSQTEGEELPDVCQKLEGDDAGLLKSLIKLAQTKEIEVTFNPCAGGGFCRYDDDDKPILININPANSTLHQSKTMSHELGHALLHKYSEYQEHRGDHELEAESVAFVVLSYLNLDTSGYSFGYVAHWQKAAGKDLEGTLAQLSKSAAAIHSASSTILEWLENV